MKLNRSQVDMAIGGLFLVAVLAFAATKSYGSSQVIYGSGAMLLLGITARDVWGFR